MTLIIDIDDTLIMHAPKTNKTGVEKYGCGVPDIEEINLVNEAYDKGHTIILHTGRNWDKYKFTKIQLEGFGIKHHELVMGKPQGIYVDKDNVLSMKELVL